MLAQLEPAKPNCEQNRLHHPASELAGWAGLRLPEIVVEASGGGAIEAVFRRAAEVGGAGRVFGMLRRAKRVENSQAAPTDQADECRGAVGDSGV